MGKIWWAAIVLGVELAVLGWLVGGHLLVWMMSQVGAR